MSKFSQHYFEQSRSYPVIPTPFTQASDGAKLVPNSWQEHLRIADTRSNCNMRWDVELGWIYCGFIAVYQDLNPNPHLGHAVGQHDTQINLLDATDVHTHTLLDSWKAWDIFWKLRMWLDMFLLTIYPSVFLCHFLLYLSISFFLSSFKK